jgi:hypothetical protein
MRLVSYLFGEDETERHFLYLVNLASVFIIAAGQAVRSL